MTMRLSEAIRLGAMNKPQAFGFDSTWQTTCTSMAAYEAIGEQHRYLESFYVPWPFLAQPCSCPYGNCIFSMSSYWKLRNIIPHLNDHHRWTREAIADWVEQFEPVKEQEQPCATSVETLVLK